MANSSHKLAVWTEGLDENWITFTGLTGRTDRDPMTAAEVAEILARINQENGDSATCQFILQGRGRQIKLSLNRGSLTVSDPANANYQNVALKMTELATYLEDFFNGKRTPKAFPEEVQSSHLRMLEGVIALVALVVFGLTVFFVSRYQAGQSGFLPQRDVTEFGQSSDTKQHIIRYAGVYATRIEDGEMVLEVKEDGSWGYYDMFKGKTGSFHLEFVEEGLCHPVLDQGRLALLADNHFVFYPSENERLIFQKRKFSLVGKSRDDLPFLIFPGK